jgi:hypothetical protein
MCDLPDQQCPWGELQDYMNFNDTDNDMTEEHWDQVKELLERETDDVDELLDELVELVAGIFFIGPLYEGYMCKLAYNYHKYYHGK